MQKIIKHCKICKSTSDLLKTRWICRKCVREYDAQRSKERYAIERQRLGIAAPITLHACGFEFDPESCPQRQKSARYRARRGQIVHIVACVNCEVKT